MIVVVLLSFVVQANARELVGSPTSHSWSFEDKLVDKVVEKSADWVRAMPSHKTALFGRSLHWGSLHGSLDSTTVAKTHPDTSGPNYKRGPLGEKIKMLTTWGKNRKKSQTTRRMFLGRYPIKKMCGFSRAVRMDPHNTKYGKGGRIALNCRPRVVVRNHRKCSGPSRDRFKKKVSRPYGNLPIKRVEQRIVIAFLTEERKIAHKILKEKEGALQDKKDARQEEIEEQAGLRRSARKERKADRKSQETKERGKADLLQKPKVEKEQLYLHHFVSTPTK